MPEGSELRASKVRRQGPDLPLFQATFDGGVREVRDFLSETLAALAPLALLAEELAAAELVLAEALNNILEHAYRGLPGRKTIRLSCLHRSDGLHVTLVDRGRGMPAGQVPLGLSQPVDVALSDLPEGGFGWFLVKTLTAGLAYSRRGNCNFLRLRVPLSDVSHAKRI